MPSGDTSGDPRIEALLERWDQLRASGLNPSAAEITQDPELLPLLERAIASILSAEAALGGSPRSPAAPAQGVPGRFESLERHDQGGMGVVYLAWDRELGRPVAYKVIKAELSTDLRAVEKFLNEARVTARLEHPGVVPVHGLTNDADGRPAYAMGFVEGVSLIEAVDRFHSPERQTPKTRAAWQSFVNHLVRVCRTVGHAHSMGVLHRDISPRNILLCEDAETLVVDWGLALNMVGGPDAEVAGRGGDAPTRAGSAAYTAPEVFDLSEPNPFSAQSDVYSIGALLYLILTGRPPFPDSTPEVFERVRQGPSPDATAAAADVPRPLARISTRAMSRKPGDRYATAEKMAHDLEAWLTGDRVSVDREPWHEAVWRWTSRHPARTTAGAFLALFAVLGLTAASIISAARAREALRTVEASQLREEAMKSKAESRVSRAHLMYVAALRSPLNPDPTNQADLVRSLLRVLEQRDQDPTTVSRLAHTYLDTLESRERSEAKRSEDARGSSSQQLRDGISALEDLAREYPAKTHYRVILARYYLTVALMDTAPVTNLAEYTMILAGRGKLSPEARKRLEETLAWYDKALSTLPPDADDVHKERYISWVGRATTLMELGRFTESFLAWDRAVPFAEGPQKALLLTIRSVILKGAEVEQSQLPWSHPPRVDHVKAIQLAEALANQEGVSAAAVYNAACAFSLASSDETADAAERRRRTDRAMTYLKRIAASNYFRPRPKGIPGILSTKDTLNELLTDHDLDALRGRPDFDKLVASVSAKAGSSRATTPPPVSTRK